MVVPRAWAERVADSLTAYRRPNSVDDFDLEKLRRGFEEKRVRFREIVEDYGGSVPA